MAEVKKALMSLTKEQLVEWIFAHHPLFPEYQIRDLHFIKWKSLSEQAQRLRDEAIQDLNAAGGNRVKHHRAMLKIERSNQLDARADRAWKEYEGPGAKGAANE